MLQNVIQFPGFRHLVQEGVKHSLELSVSLHQLESSDQLINTDCMPNFHINSLISIKQDVSMTSEDLEIRKNLAAT